MSKFKVGDRVVVPEGARVSHGGCVVRTGSGVISRTEDQEGDVRVKFDEGGGYYCNALASDVKREKVFVQPGDVSVGDKVRIRVTYDNGDKTRHDITVTSIRDDYIGSHSGSVDLNRYGRNITIEIMEKAPKPEPIKVGDKIDIEQVKTLPTGSVVSKDDSWLATTERMVTRGGLYNPLDSVSGWGVYDGDTLTVKYIAEAS